MIESHCLMATTYQDDMVARTAMMLIISMVERLGLVVVAQEFDIESGLLRLATRVCDCAV